MKKGCVRSQVSRFQLKIDDYMHLIWPLELLKKNTNQRAERKGKHCKETIEWLVATNASAFAFLLASKTSFDSQLKMLIRHTSLNIPVNGHASVSAFRYIDGNAKRRKIYMKNKRKKEK